MVMNSKMTGKLETILFRKTGKIREDHEMNLLSPEGMSFPSRLEAFQAIAYPVSKDIFIQSGLELMKNWIKLEGWEFHTMLPDNGNIKMMHQEQSLSQKKVLLTIDLRMLLQL